MKQRRTIVLGYWQPSANLVDESDENKSRAGEEFKSFVATLGYRVDIQSVHSPLGMIDWMRRDDNATRWHRDCNDENARFIIWSNVQPTDVRFATGEMLEVGDGAIILVDNLEVEHRTPCPVRLERWLIRSCYL